MAAAQIMRRHAASTELATPTPPAPARGNYNLRGQWMPAWLVW
jgi:hypothetical protein